MQTLAYTVISRSCTLKCRKHIISCLAKLREDTVHAADMLNGLLLKEGLLVLSLLFDKGACE